MWGLNSGSQEPLWCSRGTHLSAYTLGRAYQWGAAWDTQLWPWWIHIFCLKFFSKTKDFMDFNEVFCLFKKNSRYRSFPALGLHKSRNKIVLLKSWRNEKDKLDGQKENFRWKTWPSCPSDHCTILPVGSVICCWRNHSTSSSGLRHMGLWWGPIRKPVGTWGGVQQGIVATWNPASVSALGLDSNTKTFSYHAPTEMIEIQISLRKIQLS